MLTDWPGAMRHYSWQAAAEVMAAWRSSFDEFRGLPEQFAAVGGDLVVVAYHEWGRPQGGSVEIATGRSRNVGIVALLDSYLPARADGATTRTRPKRRDRESAPDRQ